MGHILNFNQKQWKGKHEICTKDSGTKHIYTSQQKKGKEIIKPSLASSDSSKSNHGMQ